MANDEQVEKLANYLKQKNLLNLREKLDQGKTLTAADQKVIAEAMEQGEKDWINKKGELAAKVGVSEPTLRKMEGEPGFPEKDSRKGWCVQDVQSFMAKRKGVGVKIKQADCSTVSKGAEYTLTRLEQSEAQAFANFEAAQKRGLTEEIKASQDLWLSLSKRLKEFELIVDRDKRDAGETIQKAEVEEFITFIGHAINNSEESFLDVLAVAVSSLENPGDSREVRQASKGLLYAKVEESMGQLIRDSKVPPWLKRAFILGLRP